MDTLQQAREALQSGRADHAVRLLKPLVEIAPAQAGTWLLLGVAYAREQRMVEATRALAAAASLQPQDPTIAEAHAQASLDAGLPATVLFEHASRLAPDSLPAVLGLAAALADEGRAAEAETRLAGTLLRHPHWLAGHKALTDLRWTSGDSHQFARSYASGCAADPQNLALRLAWFAAVVQTHDWDTALKIVTDGEALVGSRQGFSSARAYVACESGNTALAEQLFAVRASHRDDVLGVAHIRHCLKTLQWDKAQQIALDMLHGKSAYRVWPYLSVIWRLRSDARAQWLDGAPPYVRTFDLQLTPAELDELAECLRRLHRAQKPYLEQSVRGGSQTDTARQLFFRAEPELERVRMRVGQAIRDYVAAMPPPVPGHPFLGVSRTPRLFSGSWSVRLHSHGFHTSHTHPMGWISSALYVSVPEPSRRGPVPAGFLRFGQPPAALGLNLPAYGQVEPKPGLLVLFPSTLWHETVPFDDGERLAIAFDVMRPSGTNTAITTP